MGELLEKDLVYRIVGCAMAVHNEIGHGLREKTYKRALVVELTRQAVASSQQTRFPVRYKGELIDEYVPDLLVDGAVVVETKTVETILAEHRGSC